MPNNRASKQTKQELKEPKLETDGNFSFLTGNRSRSRVCVCVCVLVGGSVLILYTIPSTTSSKINMLRIDTCKLLRYKRDN